MTLVRRSCDTHANFHEIVAGESFAEIAPEPQQLNSLERDGDRDWDAGIPAVV